MKRLILTTLILLSFFVMNTGFLYPKKIATLSEIVNPYKMIIDNNRLYVSEGASIFIFSLPDGRLIKKFGQQGEGPGEFKVNPNANLGSLQFDVFPEYIVIYSIGRISFFKKQGEFLKEMKFTSTSGYFRPLVSSDDNSYVGLSTEVDNKIYYTTINICDKNLNKKKELYREKFWFTPGKSINIFYALRGVSFDVSDKLIFVEKEKETILIFDHRGRSLGAFTPPCQPSSFTSQDKKQFVGLIENSTQFKAFSHFYEKYKPYIKFPANFPNLRFILAADQKIYAITWQKDQEENTQGFVYDIENEKDTKVLFPLREMNAIVIYPFTIDDGKLYQLVENDKKGDWELFMDKIL